MVSLIIRDERPFNPDARERIKVGDELLIVTPEDQRETPRYASELWGVAVGSPAGVRARRSEVLGWARSETYVHVGSLRFA